jgi:hypothetical protein
MKKTDKTCFKLPGGKAHRLIDDPDTKHFPLGRAKCAPFARHPVDLMLTPNEVEQKDFCRYCL